MQPLSILGFLGAASASAPLVALRTSSFMALKGIMDRQIVCVPVTAPVTCARSCGPGYVTCGSSGLNCYNPGLGEVCCSNESKSLAPETFRGINQLTLLESCPAGYYCTNGGCCPDGWPLASCGATITLGVIQPPAPEPTIPSTSAAAGTTTTRSHRTTTSEATDSASATTISDPTTSFSTTDVLFTTGLTALPSNTRPSSAGTTIRPPAGSVGSAGTRHNAILDVLVAAGGFAALVIVL